jgi:tetratricopeptide (TPR) repeat protein
LRQALVSLREAAQTLPGDFRALCERVGALEHARRDSRDTGGSPRSDARTAIARQALTRRALIDATLARLDAALTLTPDDPDLLYLRARSLALWEEPRSLETCDVRRRDAETAQALERLIEVDPRYDAMQVAFDLGVVRTRLHDFVAASAAYARAIELAWSERDTVVAEANLAEVTMLAGDPAAALPHYQRAIARSAGGRDYALAQLGMAVALDRLGEHARAVETAAKAAESSGRSLAALEADGVFFEPAHERHYYFALGHEALAQLLPDAREAELRLAREAYAAFLAAAPASDPHRGAAQNDLAALDRELAKLSKSARGSRALDKLDRGAGTRGPKH